MPESPRSVQMVGVGDDNMDTSGPFSVPANTWPERCPVCSFPDLDAVPQPYRLARKTNRPVEAGEAVLGNFLVKDRPRAILEAVVPGACRFDPTVEGKRNEPGAWWLAVPADAVSVLTVDPKVPRCRACGEPKVAFPGHHHQWHGPGPEVPEVFKAREWGSYETIGEEARWYWMNVLKLSEAPAPTDRWTRVSLSRWLYFSTRLATLWKKARVKGLIPVMNEWPKPTADDLRWVDQQLARLDGLGLLGAGNVKSTGGTFTQFEAYLGASSKRKPAKAGDLSRVEATLGRSLPPSYRRFLESVGTKTYRNVDDEEGFEARVLAPSKLDFKSFRRGAMQFEPEDDESPLVDGLMFAATGHGDAFVFDLAPGAEEPPVLLYQHEGNYYEPYAPSFADCIVRWARLDGG